MTELYPFQLIHNLHAKSYHVYFTIYNYIQLKLKTVISKLKYYCQLKNKQIDYSCFNSVITYLINITKVFLMQYTWRVF